MVATLASMDLYEQLAAVFLGYCHAQNSKFWNVTKIY
jgi:hypothetical protein